MLDTLTATNGLLFASFLYRDDLFDEKELLEFWEKQFGLSFLLIPSINPLKNYYAKEMGDRLSRFFVLTSKSFTRDYLLSTKLLSQSWENNWADNKLRRVNVDVGFLTLENFLLSTTKNYSHRIYLGQNIFADLTYIFQKGELKSLPWTYPDYLDEQKKDFFFWGRSFLLQNSL